MHAASVREGDIDCGSGGHSPCGDSLNEHETNGDMVLLEGESRWHAPNVHTLMMPEQGASVSQHVSRMSLAGHALLRVARASVTGTAMMFVGLLIIGLLLMNMCSSESEPQQEVYSWQRTYDESDGARRDAITLLLNTGILTRQDLSSPEFNSQFTPVLITEWISIAEEMLKERSKEEWTLSMSSREDAQRSFQDRLRSTEKETEDTMAQFEFCDGSWATAYLSTSQQDRREAFELLLRIGIVSPAEFAESLVDRRYIGERVDIALKLLETKSLQDWVDICNTAGQRESIMSAFQTRPATYQPEEWPGALPSNSPPGTTSDLSDAPLRPMSVQQQETVSTVQLNRSLRRGVTEEMGSVGVDIPGTSFYSSTYKESHTQAAAARQADPEFQTQWRPPPRVLPPIVLAPALTPPASRPASRPMTPSASRPPTGRDSLPYGGYGGDSEYSSPDRSARDTTPPRIQQWPSRNDSQPGSASQGWPVQIAFAPSSVNNASWAHSGTMTPPRTPPASERSVGMAFKR